MAGHSEILIDAKYSSHDIKASSSPIYSTSVQSGSYKKKKTKNKKILFFFVAVFFIFEKIFFYPGNESDF